MANFDKPILDLSISIVNTNNWKYLQPCVESILTNVKNIHYEILVVDNASDDGSKEKIQEHFPGVILSCNEQRYGFAKNNNINLRKATGRYLMLLNDDTYVLPNSLENAVKFLDENPMVGVVGCKMLSPDGSYQVASARKFRSLKSEFLIETGLYREPTYINPDTTDPNGFVEIDLPSEAGMMLRREAVDQVGLLDEQFFMCGEGADWCRRIKKVGWRVVFLPSSSIIHFGGVTLKRTALKIYIQFHKSTYLYFRKENRFEAFIYRLFLILIYSLKWMYTSVLLTFLRGDKRQEKIDLLGYYVAMLDFLVIKFSDADYPFPSN